MTPEAQCNLVLLKALLYPNNIYFCFSCSLLFMAVLCNRGPLYFCPVLSSFFFSLPNLSRRRLDVYRTGLSANLECRSEMCCTRLAVNTGHNNRHLGTIAQLCEVISSQLRHVLTLGKKLVKQQYLLHMSS